MQGSLDRQGMTRGLRLALAALTLLGAVGAGAAHASDQFMKPTAEELSMTSVPGYPGASAVVLYSEETDTDEIHSNTFYKRIKILTEDGKKYANVELGFVDYVDIEGYSNNANVESIVGRTIHSDGTIIPFTGKPYLKTVEKGEGVKVQQRIFTLPDVEVGSIIEYRYAERSENFFSGPAWFLQGDLFIKSLHYTWYPTRHDLMDEQGRSINAISWFPVLPANAKLEKTDMPAASNGVGDGPQRVFTLTAKDIPPVTHEEFMPPLQSYTYRVLFSFTPFRTQQEYWTDAGKKWAKNMESFISGGGSAVEDATAKVIAGATTDDQKLQKIYAFIMGLENTRFSRAHGSREDRAAGLGATKNAGDVLSHERGTDDQLAELFIAMVRAAGMKAYPGLVPDREQHIFTPAFMSIGQLRDVIAVVQVNGKDQFFDPGQRYCASGHLAWQHTWVQGLRETGSGTDFFQTPGDSQVVNHTGRVANLKLDADDHISGKIDLTFYGAAALRWRQSALRGDEESIRHGLRNNLEHMLPSSMEVKVSGIDGLTEYDKPLAVHYTISGTLGTPTGKRLMLPVDLFEAHSTATFPHEKRELPVYFHYPQAIQDAIRINLDPTLAIEAVPDSSKANIPSRAVFNMTVQQGPTYFVTRRNYIFGDVIVPPKEYSDLRSFYSQFEAKDQENVIVKPGTAPATAANATPAAPGN